MPLEQLQAGSPDAWLKHAQSDLELARIKLPERVLFETQVDLIPPNINTPEIIQNSSILTDYADTSRYPSDTEPVTEGEHKEAVKLAETVISWVEKTIQQKKRYRRLYDFLP